MRDEKIVIIGCGAGGGTAAQFARKTNRKAKVTIFEKGCYPQYSKCGLPYTISGTISTPADLIEFTEEWFTKAKIMLHLNTTVTEIDSTKKRVITQNEEKETFEEPYDSLIIATGSNPILPQIKHIVTPQGLIPGVVTIRTIDDAKKVLSLLPTIQQVTIIGAGLIGLEMADNLTQQQKNVTVVETLPHILPLIDDDFSIQIEAIIKEHIALFTNHFATEIQTKDGKITNLVIQNRATDETENIPTDLLIIATGTKPEINLAKQIGCDIGKTGGIIVDHTSRTSIPKVYAVGDCTEYKDYVTKEPVPIGLGSIAVRQAIAAGTNAAGGTYHLPDGVLQTFASYFFHQQIAAVGPPTAHLTTFETISGRFQGSSLPGYFPGGKQILMKTTIDKDSGKILSAQAIGENAAQRINSYATAILGDMTIDTFRKLETAYAPPVAPTLDVVSLTADVAYMKQQRKKTNKMIS